MITGEVCVKVNLENLYLSGTKIIGERTAKVAFPSRCWQVCIDNEVGATAIVTGDLVNWVAFDGE